ncbi:MAG: hypothetical protein ACREXS_21930 [Gammaproteobacteria bacterium]
MSSSIDRSPIYLKRIYDDYRNVLMSRDYYACRLVLLKRWNFVYEILLAVGASGTVAGWYLWQTPVGKTSWALFAGLVALMSILKPILQVPKAIERYSKLHTGYCDLVYDFRELVDDIQSYGGITQTMRDSLAKAKGRYRDLAPQDDPKPSAKLLRKCQAEVKKKVPSFEEWCPKTN